jgi:histidinol-phosphatase (PHP family)
MMKIRSSPHNHTRFVDGRNTPEEMARAAYEKGFVSFGFSEHGRESVDTPYCLDEQSEPAYRAQVLALQDQYRGRMKIWLGVERDFYGLVDRGQYDYVIGAQHYLSRGDEHISVDGTVEGLRRIIDVFYGGDVYAMTADYFRRYADYVEDYRPDIIAHVDLVRKLNAGGRFFDEEAPRYRAPALEALERMASAGALLEINTGAIARGYQKSPYPAPFLLSRWRELGGRTIISGDCHDARFIDCAFDDCVALLQNAGFRETWQLGAGDALFEPIPLES